MGESQKGGLKLHFDGQSSEGRETWTLVQNPNDSEVQVDISYLTPDGQGNVTKTETVGGYGD